MKSSRLMVIVQELVIVEVLVNVQVAVTVQVAVVVQMVVIMQAVIDPFSKIFHFPHQILRRLPVSPFISWIAFSQFPLFVA